MDNPVAVSDLEDRWRPFSSDEHRVGATLLDDAWGLLTGPTGRMSLPADLDAGTVTTRDVVAVVCAMVLRVMRNPDGKISESVDDYSYRRADAVADGSLYVSEGELARLTPAPRRAPSGAFTIRQRAPLPWSSVY